MRSNLSPAQPGDLREVYAQLLAVAYLLEHQEPDPTFRRDPRQLAFGLGRLLETLADELDEIASNWERWNLKKS